jgi:hypothetical protein
MINRSRFLILSLVLLTIAGAAHAQATRTWVSGVGDDLNPCSRTAPCKTFAGAISKTADGGEISVLDPGGFGAVTITKGITINGEGTLAGILNSGVNGIGVNITLPTTKTVYIHNISINGAQSGLDAIHVFNGGTVVVENCWLYGQTGDGIDVNTTGSLKLKVNNTTIEDVDGDCFRLNTSSGQVVAMIDNTHAQDCTNGLEAVARVRAGVANSWFTHGTSGILTTGTDSVINMDDVFVSFYNTGIKSNNAGIASILNVSDSIIAQNAVGLDTSLGGQINSFQGNSLIGNPTPGAFSNTTNKQ